MLQQDNKAISICLCYANS